MPYQAQTRAPYRKVLYLKQSYPDNYVDSSFLSDLQRNVNVHPASLPHLLRQTLPITQHLSCTFLFLALFLRLDRGTLDPAHLLLLSVFLATIFRIWSGWAGHHSRRKTSVAPVIPLVTLYLLSPALKTLTKATTSDSIWALSGTLFAVNLFLGDYRSKAPEEEEEPAALPSPPMGGQGPTISLTPEGGSPALQPLGGSPPRPSHNALPDSAPAAPPSLPAQPAAQQLPSTLSLTAALTGSTVLASRLPSNTSVFSLLLFSTLWFGPFPLLRASLPPTPTLVLTLVLAVGSVVSLVGAGGGAGKLAGMLLLGVSVVAPLGRGWLMIRYKDRVRGPWDQAVPRVGGKGVGLGL